MLIAALDCETIPSQSLSEGCLPQFDESDVKTGNMGSEKAGAKIAAERKKFNEGLDKKMSLDPALCQVCTFCGVLYDTQKKEIKAKTSIQWPPIDGEYDVIYEACQFLNQSHSNRIPVVSYNGIGFDLPVLRHRAMILDVPMSSSMYDDLTKKYTNNHHYDLMQWLASWDKTKWKSFDFYLKLFGFEGKPDGVDGSMVYSMWQAKEYDKIQKYCESDVANLCRLFERIEAWVVDIVKGGIVL